MIAEEINQLNNIINQHKSLLPIQFSIGNYNFINDIEFIIGNYKYTVRETLPETFDDLKYTKDKYILIEHINKQYDDDVCFDSINSHKFAQLDIVKQNEKIELFQNNLYINDNYDIFYGPVLINEIYGYVSKNCILTDINHQPFIEYHIEPTNENIFKMCSKLKLIGKGDDKYHIEDQIQQIVNNSIEQHLINKNRCTTRFVNFDNITNKVIASYVNSFELIPEICSKIFKYTYSLHDYSYIYYKNYYVGVPIINIKFIIE